MLLLDRQFTGEERVWAGVAHVNIFPVVLLLPFTFSLPLLVPALIFAMTRRRSRWVAFHAFQALLYQSLILVLMMVILTFGNTPAPEDAAEGAPNVAAIAFIAIAFMYGGLAAYRSYHGRDFRYPMIGSLVERWLAPYD